MLSQCHLSGHLCGQQTLIKSSATLPGQGCSWCEPAHCPASASLWHKPASHAARSLTCAGVLPPCAEPMSRISPSRGCTSSTLWALMAMPLAPEGRLSLLYLPACTACATLLTALHCQHARGSHGLGARNLSLSFKVHRRQGVVCAAPGTVRSVSRGRLSAWSNLSASCQAARQPVAEATGAV